MIRGGTLREHREENKAQTVCKPGFVPDPCFCKERGEVFIWDVSYLTPRATDPDDDPKTGHVSSLFGLALGGVYHATFVTKGAVRSYRTLSPLPVSRRFAFCCTFPKVTLAGRYPAPCLYRARTFLWVAPAPLRPSALFI